MTEKHKTFICCITPSIFSQEYYDILNSLALEYGSITEVLENINWEPPKSYQNEMGGKLQTNIILFKRPLLISSFIELKKYCMDIEKKTSYNNSRSFNLNPGYVSNDGMFLASHKPSQIRAREYLSDNIWQEKQYDYNIKSFLTNVNTFSEFNNLKRISFFNNLISYENATRVSRSFEVNKFNLINYTHNLSLNRTAFINTAFV